MLLQITFLICVVMSLQTFAIRSFTPLLDIATVLKSARKPSSVAHASTAPTTNSRPTLTQMEYYNNYAASMYCQYQLKDLSCKSCKKFKRDVYNHKVIMNNNMDTTALVAISKRRREIVVAFRGTMNIWNVVLDFATIAVSYSNIPRGVKLHAGFHAATKSLYKDVVKAVGYWRKRFPYKIVITGHSLGGAMARLTQFYFLVSNQFPGAKYECYTYGEPRSGNRAFANFMNEQSIKTARVVNKADIVSHVPPTSVLGSKLLGDHYVHCQPEYFYVNKNKKRFCDTTVSEDPTCSDSLGPTYTITDHVKYLEVNYGTCFFGQPVPWTAIPFGIFQPVGKVPPLPRFMSDFSARVGNTAVNALRFIGL